ncbi:hypothetical protein ORV05_08225 [Amycolatopsis cynarae]|uniref:Uncharacterized protein n=1 Tax=Amycolatopsis cynarae TaxID=2995223 RepID=A0ABY7BAL6_9PSEU|nr:hypothetical protein [Amycolatopsis sp. HUAS 11-8]WAL67748.1 hypothetical protein ORV05_08225 [Amycolatopsis sp. HUAS 11-8]
MESLVEDVSPKKIFTEGFHVIAYRAMLDVPRELALYVSRLLRAERRRRGTRRGVAGVDLLPASGAGPALVPPEPCDGPAGWAL